MYIIVGACRYTKNGRLDVDCIHIGLTISAIWFSEFTLHPQYLMDLGNTSCFDTKLFFRTHGFSVTEYSKILQLIMLLCMPLAWTTA